MINFNQKTKIMKQKVKSKTQLIRNHLFLFGSITQMQARKYYKRDRLASVIYNFRKEGLDIDTINRPNTGILKSEIDIPQIFMKIYNKFVIKSRGTHALYILKSYPKPQPEYELIEAEINNCDECCFIDDNDECELLYPKNSKLEAKLINDFCDCVDVFIYKKIK